MNMRHMEHIAAVAARDVAHLQEKEATYQGSWKRRGGVGAWMMVVRKMDRLEGMLREGGAFGYDVFTAVQAQCAAERDMYPNGQDGHDGTVLAEIRDLRRYLLLVEAEMVARGAVHHGLPKVAPLPPVAGSQGDRVVAAVDRLVATLPTGPTAGATWPATSAGLPTTLVGVRARIQDLERDQASATGWGAAVGARDEELKELRSLERRLVAVSAKDGAQPDADAPVYRVTPDDRDGIAANKPAGSAAPWRVVVVGDPALAESPRWAIVDRTLVDDDKQLEHLVQLRRGLNNSEFEETCPPWFRHMYKYDERDRNEWVLQPRYNRWAETGHR